MRAPARRPAPAAGGPVTILARMASRLGRLDGLLRPSPRQLRRYTYACVIALSALVVTGEGVRLTGSGLGCPTWPACTGGDVFASDSFHALVEFCNRAVTIGVFLIVAATVLAVLGVRASPAYRRRRRQLGFLAGGLVGGYVLQAIIGGLTVLFRLAPELVMLHLLASMLLVWDAVLLHVWTGQLARDVEEHPDPIGDGSVGARAVGARAVGQAPLARPRVELVWLGRVLVLTTWLVMLAGTVVTGSGPYAGKPGTPRLPFLFRDVAQLHADFALLLTGLIIASLFAVRLAGANATVRRRARQLAALVVAQVVVGYTQYFLIAIDIDHHAQYFHGVPRVLIVIHVAGATALWATALGFTLAAADPRPALRRLAGRRAPGSQPVTTDTPATVLSSGR